MKASFIVVVICSLGVESSAEMRAMSKAAPNHDIPSSSHRQRREVSCFERLGCFSNEFPYNNTGGYLPAAPGLIQTTFFVFTRTSQFRPGVIRAGHFNDIRLTSFVPNASTKFIVHGFLQKAENDWVKNMTRLLLRKEVMNVVVVDWGKGAGFPYSQAAANTRVVGAEIVELVNHMTEHGLVNPALVHLIGHSLGAHVAGYVGERITDIARITGLDPADPCFQYKDPAVRLDPLDALFVDVIHTDGSHYNTVSGYGMSQAVGHLDFYPNGGYHQPGCLTIPWFVFASGMSGMDVDDMADTLSCSHSRAISLFLASLESGCTFTSFKCNDVTDFGDGACSDCGSNQCAVMGYDADQSSARGKFYLKTQAADPFCGYQFFVSVHTGHGMRYASGILYLSLIDQNGIVVDTDFNSEKKTFMRSRVYRAVLLTRVDVRQLSGIRLRFQSKNFFSWGSTTISLAQVSVTIGNTGQTLSFCPENLSIGNESVALTSTSNDSSSC